MVGEPPQGPALLVCNHVSWLDIPVLGGALGARFVSKGEIARAPVVGWMARENGSVFVTRDDRGGAGRQVATLRAALADRRPVLMFPEGTTSDGRAVLPFRSSLFAAVAPAPAGVAVQTVALIYGDAREAVAWHGDEPALPSVLRILGRRGAFTAVVRIGPTLAPGTDRKALAVQTHEAVAFMVNRN